MQEGVRQCPVDHETMRQLWAENGPIVSDLREVTEVLSGALASSIAYKTGYSDPVTKWPVHQLEKSWGPLPFGDPALDPYRKLPPDFFRGRIFQRKPEIPADQNAGEKLVRRFLRMAAGRQFVGLATTVKDEALAEELPVDMVQLVEGGQRIDLQRWKQYVGIARAQRWGHIFHLEALSSTRNQSVREVLRDERADLLQRVATGRHSEYMYQANRMLRKEDGEDSTLVGFAVMPIGAYGRDFAEKLLATATYAVEYADVLLKPKAAELAAKHGEVVGLHTTRGRDEPTPEQALLRMTQEGVISILQTASLMTSEKVEGYEDPIKLLRDIVDAGLIEEFARSVPMGVVAPFTLCGAYFPGLVKNVNGKLQLDQTIMAEIKAAKHVQVAYLAAQWATYRAAPDEGALPQAPGLICPAAFAHGGISTLSDALVKAMEAIRPPRKSGAHRY